MRDCPTVPDEVYAQLSQLNGATLFHRREWHQVLEEAFGWRVRALVDADATGRCSFFLPYVRKRRMGRRVSVCLPLSSRIGPAWREPSSARVDDIGSVAPLEIHEEMPGQDWRLAAHHVETVLHFDDPPAFEAWFRKLGDPRRRVKKAGEGGYRVRRGERRDDFLVFSSLQAETRRRQGAPTYPSGFFPAVQRHLAEAGLATLYLVENDVSPVAGIVLFYDGATAHYAYGASKDDPEAVRSGVNQLAMYAAIEEAYRQGIRCINFGSSPVHHVNLRRYKESWGGESAPLVYSFSPAKGGSYGLDQGGIGVALAGKVLRRLPLPVFRRVTPALLRAVL